MTDLEELQKAVLQFRDERNWKQFHNPKDITISLVLEATELLEHFQWKNDKEMREHIISHKDDVSDELADVLYWVLLIAHDLDIDLMKAVTQKLAKNRSKYPVDKAKNSHAKYTEL
jgi:dCTP diphosphatase